MGIKFTVGTNFQDDFLEKINKKDVCEIFGKLTSDFVGGGRSSRTLPVISKKILQGHIKEVHANGIKFNYLLNAACLGNREFTPQGMRQIRKLLDWLEKIDVDSVTVALPYLLELVRKRYPRFKTRVSIFARVSNLATAKYWEELGADTITLESTILNRDFEALRKIRQNINCHLELIANNSCLCFCPFAQYHSVTTAHASHSGCKSGGIIEYCILKCKYTRLKDPVNFIRSDWIRPEDTHYYEEAGIDSLKIVGRTASTDTVALAVDAYTRRKYSGNLADLIPMYQGNPFFHKQDRSVLPSKIPLSLDVYIDNCALSGFLDFFVQGKCKGQGTCAGCGHCHRASAKAVKLGSTYKRKTLYAYKGIVEKML